jgi:uncharacterized alkaline shock family protein YloU
VNARDVDVVAGRDTAAVERVVDRIASRVSGVRGVARLMPGPIATYLPHRTVPGVALRDGTVLVSVAARYGESLPDVANRVRSAARQAAPDLRVDVLIEDVEVEGK